MERFKSFISKNKSKSTSTEIEPGFSKDADGNVFISHDTSFRSRDRKKDKKKDTNESIVGKVKKAFGMKADHEKTLDDHAAKHNKEDHSQYLSDHSERAHKDPHDKKAFHHFKKNTTDMNEHLIEAHKHQQYHSFRKRNANDHEYGNHKHVHMDDFKTFPSDKNLEKIHNSESHVHHTIIKHSKPLGKKISLYHGTSHDFGKAAKESKNGIVHNPAHMSTSHDHKVGQRFGDHIVVVHADKKTKAVHIDGKGSEKSGNVHSKEGEKETVIPAGTALKHIKSHKTSDGYDVHHFKVHSQHDEDINNHADHRFPFRKRR